MNRKWIRLLAGCSLLVATETARRNCWAMPQEQAAAQENSIGLKWIERLAEDQEAIWTSPFRLQWADADWLVPLGVATGGTLATDTEFSKHLSSSPVRLRYSRDFSNFGVAGMAAAGGGLYFLGRFAHDDQKREAGILAGEAAVDSYGVASTLKFAFGRERPLADSYRGHFLRGGDSFPSEHAAAAWSIASVIAHEYPGTLTTLVAYGAASAISASRITAKEHFPSDVLVGSAIGWFVGQHVYRAHHDPKLGGSDWETYAESQDPGSARQSKSPGSPYVELDSWIYPAIERLADLGYIRSAFLGMRPWTRIECARLVEEAGETIESSESLRGGAGKLYAALQREFRSDLAGVGEAGKPSVEVESLYTAVEGISGAPLNDSYHFGQTIINDYGRPYQEGFNSYDGVSGYATAGRFTVYMRGEYQRSPSGPAYSLAVRSAIANADSNPVQPAAAVSAASQYRLLDTYVAANLAGWELAFGKQSLWWGPNYGSDLVFSDNAEPIYMFRASRIEPIALPWISRWLGPLKLDLFFGKLSGHEFPPRPMIHGEKFSFKPTPNIEFGFSRTTVFSGVGKPLTWHLLGITYLSVGNNPAQNTTDDPGDRRGGFDFSYRLPYLRNWLTLYANSMCDDDVSPLSSPRRAAMNPGLHLTQLPGAPKADLRVEAVYTDLPIRASHSGEFNYWNGQ